MLRDRNALYRTLDDGDIENSYTVKLINKLPKASRYSIQLLDAEDRIIGVENWRSATDRYLTYCQANDIEPRDLSRPLKARPAALSTTD